MSEMSTSNNASACPIHRILSILETVIAAPKDDRKRRIEHAICVGLLGYLGYKAIKKGPRKLLKSTVGLFLAGAKVVPGLNNVIAAEQEKVVQDLEEELLGEGDEDANTTLPKEGKSASELLKKANDLRKTHKGFDENKTWGGIYHHDGDELVKLQNEMYAIFNCSNALYPGTFPSVRKFEAEIITMTVNMLHGSKDACGLLTSGGTESILLAVLAYRNYARSVLGIEHPEIICNAAAHPALDKACKYFDVKLVKLPIQGDCRLSAAQVAPYINRNTVAIYASAPSFPHGVIDRIEELGQLALQKKVCLHVDNCLGGFLLSAMQRLGLIDKKFDMSVPGVTTMSVDLHKYGCSSKGASTVIFSMPELRRQVYSGVLDWCGGFYVTPTMQGSRSGAIMAGAWATIMYKGENGYNESARKIYDLQKTMMKEISSIPHLHLVTDADAGVIPFGSKDLNIYAISTLMNKKGWSVIAMQSPACAGICLGETMMDVKDIFLKDLRNCVNEVANDSSIKAEGHAGVYGMAAVLPDEQIEDTLKTYCDIRVRVKPAVHTK